jgi:putative inorganic carbon (hco3(-)) transporter
MMSILQLTPPLSTRSVLLNGLAVGFSVALGILITTQPPVVALILIGVVAVLFFTLVTPLAALAALLILVPMRALIATEVPRWPLPLDILQLLMLVVLSGWVVYCVAHNRRLVRLGWLSLYFPLLLYLGVLALTAFQALSLSAWVTEWLKWVLMVLMVVLAGELGRNRGWEWLVFALVVAGVANALVGIYIFLGGSGAWHMALGDRFFRAFGTFGQPNPFGGFMGLLAPIALAMAWGYLLRFFGGRGTHRSRRLLLLGLGFYGVGGLLLVVGVLISWSRGAWIALTLSMLVMLLALPRRLWHGISVGLLLILLLLGLWFGGYVPQSIGDRLASVADMFAVADVRGVDITLENYPVIERLAHWQAAVRMAEAEPYLGVGFGNYEVAYDLYRLIDWRVPLGHAHNYYLNVLAEAGIIGALVYFWLLLMVLWLGWRVRCHPDEQSRCFAVGFVGMWSYFLVHSLTDSLYVNGVFLHIGVLLGILSVLHHELVFQRRVGIS